MKCVVCGGDDFTHGEVLSDELVDEWEINETERGYIDRQQGTGGLLCYTVPTIVQRMTRTREGLPPSYHGTPGAQEYLVVSEYGADVWQQMIEAGFDDVKITTFDYPAGIAISSSNGPIPVIPTPPPERTLFEKLFGMRL